MQKNNKKSLASLNLPECYIYLYHTDEYFILPQYPESIADTLSSTFASQNAISRTAPVFAYSNSGPRSIQVTLSLHRDMMTMYNTNVSNVKLSKLLNRDDYVDVLIAKLQSIALPKYNATTNTVKPPMVAIRFGNEIFIKGVVNGGVTVNYKLPLLSNNKYALVDISFTVYETTPYDAESVGKLGSFRGLTTSESRIINGGIKA